MRFVVGFWTILIWVTKKDKTCKLICGMVKKKTALLQWFLLNKLHFILSMQHWVKKTSQKLSLHSEKLKSKHLSFISCHKSIYFLFFLVGMWEKKRDFFFWRRSFQIKLYQIIQLVSTALWNSVLLENNDGICNISVLQCSCLCDAFHAGSLMTLLL